MSNIVRDLIDAIDSGKSVDIDASFSEVFASKVSDGIDNLRSQISSNLFSSNTQAEESIETEEITDNTEG